MVKNPAANAGDTGDMGLIPGLEKSSGEGNGNPFQFFCFLFFVLFVCLFLLGKSHGQRDLMGCDTAHGVTKESDMT